MPAPAQTQSLQVLMRHAEQQRDLALGAVRTAADLARRARMQCEQLRQYRCEYQGRWSAQFNQGATVEILACYRSFMQRLDQAVTQQARQAEASERRHDQARAMLLESERRVASVRKLIERRGAELALTQRLREQKLADELAQRMRWRALQADAPNTQ